MNRRRLRVLLAAAGGLLLLAAAGRAAAWVHVKRFVASGPVDVTCGRCHGDRPLFRRDPRRDGYPDPAGMAVSRDGRSLFVACEGSDSLAVADLASGRVRAEVRFPAGARPHGVAAAADGRTVFVSLRGRDTVARVDAAGLTWRESGEVGRGPCGVALDPAGRTLVVACAESDDAALVDAETLVVDRRLRCGREPYAVAVSPDGRRAHVANRLSGPHGPREAPASEVTVLDLPGRRVAARVPLPSVHLAEGAVFLPDGSRSLLAAVRVRNLVPVSQVARGWVMSGAVVLVPAEGDGPAAILPSDDMDRYRADPAGVAVAPDGSVAAVAAAGSDEVSLFGVPALLAAAAAPPPADGGEKADRMDLAADLASARVATGANPRAVAFSPDGRLLLVAERWDGTVAVLDAATRRVLRRVDLGGPRGSPSRARRGDRVFHSASITFQGGFSCRSCHPDGHQDGLTYDFESDGPGRNRVDNRSLLGVRGTNPFKWNGLNAGLADQCGPRFARVLTRADPHPPGDLADLVAYIDSLPPRRGSAEVSAAVERGRTVFFRARANDGRGIPEGNRCSTCHPPPLYSDRRSSDVGTRGPLDSPGGFDAPHLAGAAASAPFLHDGRAATLEEIWTEHNPGDRHGVSNDMTKQQLNDLVEFLKSL